MTVGSATSAPLPPLPPPATGGGAPKVANTPAAFKAPTSAPAPAAKDNDGDHDGGTGGKVNVLA